MKNLLHQGQSLLPKLLVVLLGILSTPSVYADGFNRWTLKLPVDVEIKDDYQDVKNGYIHIGKPASNSMGGSVSITFDYVGDAIRSGCPAGSKATYLYTWDFDRDVSTIVGEKGATLFVAKLGLQTTQAPPADCPVYNPFLTIRSTSNNWAQDPDARFYAVPSLVGKEHDPSARIIKNYNPQWEDGSIQVELYGGGGVGHNLTVNLKYNFTGGVIAPVENQSDCLFNWAESNYAYLFAPPNKENMMYQGITYRYYPQTNSYLGANSVEGYVYVLASAVQENSIVNVGPISYWANLAGCR